MATSPTPSLDSLPGANSIGSFGEHNDYLSDSPLTLSGSSPPVSDSAICDDFSSSGATSSLESHHQANSSSSASSASSTSSSSGLSCGSGPGVIGSGSGGGPGGGLTVLGGNSSVINITNTNGTAVPRCTACKSKQSDAVAKCYECANFLCSNCVAAHEFMNCFDGHTVSLFNGFDNTSPATLSQLCDLKFNSTSLSMILSSHQTNPTVATANTAQKQSQLTQLMMTNDMSGTTNLFDTNGPAQNQRYNIKDELMSKLSISSLANNGGGINNNDILSSISSATNNLFTSTNGVGGGQSNSNNKTSHQFCNRHKHEIKFYCRTCSVIICKDCIVHEHPSNLHEVEHLSDATHKQSEHFLQVLNECRNKSTEIVSIINNSDHNLAKIKLQYQKAIDEINETYQFFRSMLDERKHELLKELESFYNAKTSSYSAWISRSKEFSDKLLQSCDSSERLSKQLAVSDILLMRKTFEQKIQSSAQFIQELQSTCELDFVSNYQAIQVGVRNTFGYIRSTADVPAVKQPPIARPNNNSNNMLNNHHGNGDSNGSLNMILGNGCVSTSALERQFSNTSPGTIGSGNNGIIGQSAFDSNIISKRFNSVNNFGPFVSDVNLQLNPYEKWSNGGSDNLFNGLGDQYGLSLSAAVGSGSGANGLTLNGTNLLAGNGQTDSINDLTSKLLSTTIYPPKSQIKRQKMIYHCKFGEFGVLEGQFTEPSGVAVNAQNDIIVADTNNHRIQIFDKEGRFKFQFGECGKRDGQLLYPNRVAVVKTSGDIIVTERSPTHQIQIYNQYGQFVRKFGANILQHPRGVTVDNKGRIIVVECKVMRVIIFDQNGNVMTKFGCSKHLEFPNGVVVNDKQEIFISDNRAHCVKVFNYDGQYLRQIGGEGVTNYPIGVGINSNGEILIADNHNNFNLTIFTQDGQLVSALESKVKHAQCFDVALMDDGSVVLASKDYRLYIYRYVQIPPIGL